MDQPTNLTDAEVIISLSHEAHDVLANVTNPVERHERLLDVLDGITEVARRIHGRELDKEYPSE